MILPQGKHDPSGSLFEVGFWQWSWLPALQKALDTAGIFLLFANCLIFKAAAELETRLEENQFRPKII